MKLYRQIASSFMAMNNCIKSENDEWKEKHFKEIQDLCREFLPSESGFDCDTQFDFIRSRENKLVFISAFHHMDENGMYDVWSDLKIIITPCFSGFDIRITGINRKYRYDKEFFIDTFCNALETEIN